MFYQTQPVTGTRRFWLTGNLWLCVLGVLAVLRRQQLRWSCTKLFWRVVTIQPTLQVIISHWATDVKVVVSWILVERLICMSHHRFPEVSHHVSQGHFAKWAICANWQNVMGHLQRKYMAFALIGITVRALFLYSFYCCYSSPQIIPVWSNFEELLVLILKTLMHHKNLLKTS